MNMSINDQGLKFWHILIIASGSENFCNHNPLFKVLSNITVRKAHFLKSKGAGKQKNVLHKMQ